MSGDGDIAVAISYDGTEHGAAQMAALVANLDWATAAQERTEQSAAELAHNPQGLGGGCLGPTGPRK